MFIDLLIYYTGHLWQGEVLGLDEAEVDREIMVYPPALKLLLPLPLHCRPPLLLHPPLLVVSTWP